MKKFFIVLIVYMFTNNIQARQLTLASLFTNNMVLQQNSAAHIWGTAEPKQEVTVLASWGSEVHAVADDNGLWHTVIPTIGAGGPFQITVRSNTQQLSLENVLLGEVWLCSGQSNMEMPLRGWPPKDTIDGGTEAIAQSANTHIRLYTVKRAYSLTPLNQCVGTWVEAMPETAAWFSATAYFFGKRLYDELHVPIGLINVSWGGTPAEAWASAEALGAHPDFAQSIQNRPLLIAQAQEVQAWITSHPGIDVSQKADSVKWKNLSLHDELCSRPETNDSAWQTLELPHGFENSEIGDFDGVIWFRRQIDVPAELCKGQVEVRLPAVDDMDQVWINGTLIGATEQSGFWSTARSYRFDGQLLKPGKNLFAIRIADVDGGGGIWDSESAMELRSVLNPQLTVNLKGEYRYAIVACLLNQQLYLINPYTNEWMRKPKQAETIGSSTPAALYNGMINPLIPFTIRGAIWYQGESNVGRAGQYKTLFPALIEGWRTAWKQGDFPFYFVQICPWHYGNSHETQAAELREAQRICTQTTPNTGMVVTLDLGDLQNIHPPCKRPVGERLALWALAKTYNKPIVCSGPTPTTMTVKKQRVIISFSNAESGLRLTKSDKTAFAIAGDDGVFMPAKVKISGNTLLLKSAAVKIPRKVRYEFHNGAVATLYNNDGLPASGFELQ